MAKVLARAAINNAILDPLSGFDVDVYVQDQVSGKQILAGSFTSFQFTVRNSTEPYMEFNQRIPRLLDGEYQFGWVLERGCVDVRFIQQTFGIDSMTREMRLNRSPRFQITVELNAPELDNNSYADAGQLRNSDDETRKAKGRYRLMYAKTDALTFGAMAGRSVVANRWEGLCEGILYSDHTKSWAGVNLNEGTDSSVYNNKRISELGGSETTEFNGRPNWGPAADENFDNVLTF